MNHATATKTVTLTADQVEQVKFALRDRAGMLAGFITGLDKRFSPDSFAVYTRLQGDVYAALSMLDTQEFTTKAAPGTLDDLEGQNLRTVITALNFMRHAFICGSFAKVSDVLDGQIIASPDALNAVLLFLESPK